MIQFAASLQACCVRVEDDVYSLQTKLLILLYRPNFLW